MLHTTFPTFRAYLQSEQLLPVAGERGDRRGRKGSAAWTGARSSFGSVDGAAFSGEGDAESRFLHAGARWCRGWSLPGGRVFRSVQGVKDRCGTEVPGAASGRPLLAGTERVFPALEGVTIQRDRKEATDRWIRPESWDWVRFAFRCLSVPMQCLPLKRKVLRVAWLLPLWAAGCTSPCTAVMTDVNPAGWCLPAEVSITNTDTLAARELHVVLRSTGAFAGDTLTLRIGVCAPDSLCYEEPFPVRLSPPKAGPVARETRTLYRSRVILADTGRYRFTITPVRSVRGVEAVGLCILPDRQ